MSADSFFALFLFVAACLATGSTGAIFRAADWYERLAKPAWRPPNRIFAPVWTALYLAMAVSGWLAWRESGVSGAPLAMVLYGVQLVLNAAWSPLFFGMRRPDLAFYEILLLWLSIAATMILFQHICAASAWLLAPYLAWVTFAAALNFSIWRLNPVAGRAG